MSSNNREHWNDAEIFWAELAPAEHLVQIYEEERVFMNALEGFVIGGIRCGDGVIVIATEDHRNELEHRLLICGIDVDRGRSRGQYIDLDAEDTLSKFMIGEWPDDDLFQRTVTEIVSRARGEGRGANGARVWRDGCDSLGPWSQCGDGPARTSLALVVSLRGLPSVLRIPKERFHSDAHLVLAGNLFASLEASCWLDSLRPLARSA